MSSVSSMNVNQLDKSKVRANMQKEIETSKDKTVPVIAKPVISANPIISVKKIEELNPQELIFAKKIPPSKQKIPVVPILPEKSWFEKINKLLAQFDAGIPEEYLKYSPPRVFSPAARDTLIAASIGLGASAAIAVPIVAVTTAGAIEGITISGSTAAVLGAFAPLYVLGLVLIGMGVYWGTKRHNFKQYDIPKALSQLKHDPEIKPQELFGLESTIQGIRAKLDYFIKHKMEGEILERLELPAGINNLKDLIKKIDAMFSGFAFLIYKLYHKPQYLSEYEKKVLAEFFPEKNINRTVIINRFSKVNGLDFQRVIDYYDAKYKTDPAAAVFLEKAVNKMFANPRLLSTKERDLLEFLINPDFIKYLAREYKSKKGNLVQINGIWYKVDGNKRFEKANRA